MVGCSANVKQLFGSVVRRECVFGRLVGSNESFGGRAGSVGCGKLRAFKPINRAFERGVACALAGLASPYSAFWGVERTRRLVGVMGASLGIFARLRGVRLKVFPKSSSSSSSSSLSLGEH